MRKLVLILLLGGIAPKVFAPTIRVLYQPVPDLDAVARSFGADSWSTAHPAVRAKVKENVEILSPGHLAIQLPKGTLDGGTTFGWQPSPSSELPLWHPMANRPRTKVVSWLQNFGADHKFPSIPGSFLVDDQWAAKAANQQYNKLEAFSLEVTDQELKTIAENIKRVNNDPRYEYQMIPNGDSHAPFRMNCVTALDEAFAGTQVKLTVPANGSISKFIRMNQWRKSPCFFDILGEG